ncbi:hypothetical protein ACWDUH_23830, partial [Micromonospora wenchangensis]
RQGTGGQLQLRPQPAGGAQLQPVPDATTTVHLRSDRRAGRPVDVFEVRRQGQRLRYWLDRSGFLHRLELRTTGGLWAQLELTPGPLPAGIVPAHRKPPPPTRPR